MQNDSLTADRTIVVLADLQEGIVNLGVTGDVERLRICVGALLDLATAFAIPVIATCVPTTGGTVAPLLTEIATRLADAQPIVRTTANAMDDAAFCAALEASGRKTIVFAGVATEVVVRLTALTAQRHGYHAIVAIDACSGLDARTESATLTHLSSAGVELSTVATIAAQLAGDFSSELGRVAMRALQSTLTLHGHGNSGHDHDPDRGAHAHAHDGKGAHAT